MEIKEVIEAVRIEGAENGDVVFIEVAGSMSAQDFVKFGKAFRAHADRIRAEGYFPRSIILPPGTRAVVAQRHASDAIAIEGDVVISGQLATSPDDGSPHG